MAWLWVVNFSKCAEPGIQLRRLRIGDPVAAGRFSVDDLKRLGIMGAYRPAVANAKCAICESRGFLQGHYGIFACAEHYEQVSSADVRDSNLRKVRPARPKA
jgi:hypothetical protein